MVNVREYVEQHKVEHFAKLRAENALFEAFVQLQHRWADLSGSIISYEQFQELLTLSQFSFRYRFQYLDRPFTSYGNQYRIDEREFTVDFGPCTARFPRESIRYIRLRPIHGHLRPTSESEVQFVKIGFGGVGDEPVSIEIALWFDR